MRYTKQLKTENLTIRCTQGTLDKIESLKKKLQRKSRYGYVSTANVIEQSLELLQTHSSGKSIIQQ